MIPGMPAPTFLSARGRFDFYLNSAVASSGDGTHPTRAFKTVADLEAAVTPYRGLRIGVVRGSSFREEIDWSNDMVTIEAIGSGAAPIFDASDVLSSGGWTDVTDGSYSRALTLPNIASSFVNVWEDDAYLTLAASQAACASTPGTYFPSAHYGAITLYIHPTTGAPASNGSTYEVTSRQYGIRLSGVGSRITGIHGRKNHANDGSLVLGTGGYMIGCRAAQGSKHNGFIADGGTVDTCTFDEAYFGGGSANLLIMFQNAASIGATILNSTFSLATLQAGITGIYHHANSGAFDLITVSGCTFTNLANGYSGTEVTTCVLADNIFNGCTEDINAYGATVTITGGQTVSDVASGRLMTVPAASQNITIDGIKICRSGFNGSIIRSAQTGLDITIQNATIRVPVASLWSLFELDHGALTLTGNIFDCSEVPYAFIIGRGTNVTLTASGNAYDREVLSFEINGSTYNSVTAYKAGTSQDADATTDGDGTAACA